MRTDFSQTIAYFCPDCAWLTYRQLNIFEIANSSLVFYCGREECAASSIRIFPFKDTYKFLVNCSFCTYTHEFTVKKSSFWSKKFRAFKCSNTGMSFLYIGDRDRIREEAKKGDDIFPNTHDKAADSEFSLYVDILTELDSMRVENAIQCNCGCMDIDFDIKEDSVDIICYNCGAVHTVNITIDDYDRLVNTDTLKF